VITKLLVANRAEIAVRVVRSARTLGIPTVAVFSDADAGAPHVTAADEAVRLPGRAAADTYLRADLVVDAARRTGADAVHPGYGFLSESAAFARRCADAGLTFVGPPPGVIERMGSKIEAKQLMADAAVPVLPGATVAPGATPAELRALGDDVGYPLLVKAAFGGGGRGMRIVEAAAPLEDAVAGAQREAEAAFGDGSVFLERYVAQPRHVEVQVVGDVHGTVAHLFERECSIQRRHQKLIEETPSTALDDRTRARMCDAAVTAARAIGYVNAGTVEFVLDGEGNFWFLEVNTRLQVEHPVTEMVTGLDLVALQLAVAQGAALPAEVTGARTHGHAVEARLYAEDAAAGDLPVTGTLHRFRVPTGHGVRVDTGYEDGSEVTPFYDAMLAKVVAWAPTREEATRRLAAALRGAEIHGPVTNRDLLVGVLEHPEWVAGRTDTGFLDRNSEVRTTVGTERVRRVHAFAAALATVQEHRRRSPIPAGVPSMWRNVGPASQRFGYRERDETVEVSLPVGDDVVVVSAAPDAVELELDGVRHRVRLHHVEDAGSLPRRPVVYADSALGSSTLEVLPRFPLPEPGDVAGSLLAPMPGSVVHVAARVGDAVAAGTVLVVLEAMKMEHALRAPHAGVVREVRVETGAQVDSGTVLVVVEADAGAADG
jgi:acetyl/propionyl-CoA carboxylase alpha subunit